MTPFNALFDEFKGVLGKAYVLAGFIPAAVLVGSLLLYFSRSSSQEIFSAVADELGKETWTGAAVLTAIVAVVGLVFFAARSVVMTTTQTLEGRPLAAVRYALTRLQIRASQRAEFALNQSTTDLTILDMWISDLDFERPTLLPDGWQAPSSKTVVRSTRKSIAAMYGHLAKNGRNRPPRRRAFKKVRKGLRHLYAYHHYYDDKISETAIARWRECLKEPSATAATQTMADSAHRDLVIAEGAAAVFPDEAKWIQPTRLGNRAASLDDYAEIHYGIDTSTIISRLVQLVSDPEREQLSDGRIGVETLLNLMVASGTLLLVFTVDGIRESIVTLASVGLLKSTPNWHAIIAIVASAFAARLFYLGALRAYDAMAEHIRRVVDLNRLALIEHLGLPMPDTMASERRLWRELAVFLKTGAPMDPPPPIVARQIN